MYSVFTRRLDNAKSIQIPTCCRRQAAGPCYWLIMSLYNEEKQRFKQALKDFRKSKGLKQAEVADMLGASLSSYVNWEKLGSIPSSQALIDAIQDVIGFTFKVSRAIGAEDSIVQYIKDSYLKKSINELALDTGYTPRMVYNILSAHKLESPFEYIQGANICFDCINAVPTLDGTRGCNWSRHFKPVKGWKATKVPFKLAYERMSWTYSITECPKFKKG